MTWPDGFSHSGKWTVSYNTIDGIEPTELVIHPKIKECLENKMCTRFSGVDGPQMTDQASYGNHYCEHCAKNCKQTKTQQVSWIFMAKCRCECQQNGSSLSNLIPVSYTHLTLPTT
eukprot:TRINITY_DN3912_c0_g1_i2.p1 TRINITY_DN3912_c0_g1~~TRINITY_DN3912_c0_g1_i2.p1  ORF type:complete len:116 (+),score=8.96 TRINITY_DN3912_c0_g1_i2:281-628(+)